MLIRRSLAVAVSVTGAAFGLVSLIACSSVEESSDEEAAALEADSIDLPNGASCTRDGECASRYCAPSSVAEAGDEGGAGQGYVAGHCETRSLAEAGEGGPIEPSSGSEAGPEGGSLAECTYEMCGEEPEQYQCPDGIWYWAVNGYCDRAANGRCAWLPSDCPQF